MKRTKLRLLVLLSFAILAAAALIGPAKSGSSIALVPSAQCTVEDRRCPTWCQNCRDAAHNQYNTCVASGIPAMTCDLWSYQAIIDCYAGLPCNCRGDGGGDCWDARAGSKVPCN